MRGVAASVLFNTNTGKHSIESKEPLYPLDVCIQEPIRVVRLSGAALHITQRFGNLSQLDETILSLYFALPALLNVPFADPPYVERVDGTVNGVSFLWELDNWEALFHTTTQEEQEQHFAKSWERLPLVCEPRRRRLVAALHYFHVACRLAREGSTPGEFVAEVVLNLAKSLEVLFPPSGKRQGRDAVRSALYDLGFSNNQVESDFMPAIALRNEIDVAHVHLGIFTLDQLRTIHSFTDRAEAAFRIMFDRLLLHLETGKLEIAAHEPGPPRKEAIALIDRMRKAGAEAARQSFQVQSGVQGQSTAGTTAV